MNQPANAVDKKFWRVFKRVLDVDDCPQPVSKDALEEWDSLKHVELVFELEEAFELDISSDDIVALYSDTDAVRAYLHERVDQDR